MHTGGWSERKKIKEYVYENILVKSWKEREGVKKSLNKKDKKTQRTKMENGTTFI